MAAKHGLDAALRVLPNENQHEFDELLSQYRRTFAPATIHEHFLVEEMAQSRWRLARFCRFEIAVLEQMTATAGASDVDAVLAAALIDGTAGPFKTLERYAAAAERSYHRALKQLQSGRGQELQNEPKSASPEPLVTKSPSPAPSPTQLPPAYPVQVQQFVESNRGRTRSASPAGEAVPEKSA